MSSANSKKTAHAILAKSGWEQGKGLGRNEQGDVEHIKVQQKDGNLGIGYNAQVAQVWSQQSVAFADVLSKFSSGAKKDEVADDDDDDEDNQPVQAKKQPAAGKHSVLYDKRRKLKTEGLTSDAGKSEILASAASGRRRQRGGDGDEGKDDQVDVEENSSDNDNDGYKSKKDLKAEKTASRNKEQPEAILPMTLSSPLLRRMCERVGAHEPKKRGEDDAVVTIKMPEPKPPRCTATPFKYQKGE